MPKFSVTIEETVYYDVIVEATSATKASEAGELLFNVVKDNSKFFSCVGERKVCNVENIDHQKVEP